MKPKISIVIPVYNVESYLKQCLDSALGQTLREIEIICVNDGSPDHSHAILEEYAAKDPRMIVIQQQNQGLSGARNTGMAHVSGEYILFLDADDWLEVDCCEKSYAIAKQQDVDVVIWNFIQEFPALHEYMHIVEGGKVYMSQQVHDVVLRQCFGLYRQELAHPEWFDAHVNVWGRIYRTQTIQDHDLQYVDTKRIGTEDALFNMHFFAHARSLATMDEYFSHYRMSNASSLTSVYQQALPQRWAELFARMDGFRQEMQLGDACREALDNRVAMSILWLGRNIQLSGHSWRQKARELRDILCGEPYQQVFRRVDASYYTIQWRIILALCKRRMAGLLHVAFWLGYKAGRLVEKRAKPSTEKARIVEHVAM